MKSLRRLTSKTKCMRKTPLLTLLFIVSGIGAFAQSATKISGTINDEGGKVLPSATVSLLRAKDSGLVKVAITNKEGVT